MSAIDRVRIMVLGDSGVGKTSFVHLVINGEPISSPSWTVGCTVEVKLHEYREGTKDQQTYFLEFWDIGGSNNHRNTRPVFYSPCHGVVLVHDLTNRKSEENLRKWLDEVITHKNNETSGCNLTAVSIGRDDHTVDCESFFGNSFPPILVIGTKLDQLDENKKLNANYHPEFATQYSADQIILDCRSSRYLAAGSSNAVKLSRFYDKVIEMKYEKHKNSFTERLSTNISPTLSSKFYLPHQD